MMDLINNLKPKIKETCPGCGLPNKCGIEAGKGTYWCFSETRMDANQVDFDKSCFCVTCLRKSEND